MLRVYIVQCERDKNNSRFATGCDDVIIPAVFVVIT